MKYLKNYLKGNFPDLKVATANNFIDNENKVVIYKKDTGEIVNEIMEKDLENFRELSNRDKKYYITGKERRTNVRSFNTFQKRMDELEKEDNVNLSAEIIREQTYKLLNSETKKESIAVILKELTKICNNSDIKLLDIVNQIV